MNREEAEKLLSGGKNGIAEWNRRRKRGDEIPSLNHISLNKSDLSGANLSAANLGGAFLSGANLSGANLSAANLSGASLSWTNLSEAKLRGANLSKAYLCEANLSKANLYRTNLSGALLSKILPNFNGANLSGADLREVNLSNANLSGVDLHEADLSGVDLSGANLSGADISKANLGKVNLSKANLYNANIRESDLGGAFLENAILRHADFSYAKFTSNPISDDINNLHDTSIESERDAIGLQLSQLAGVNFTHARLPKYLHEHNFDSHIKNLEDACKNARPIFLGVLTLCAFIFLAMYANGGNAKEITVPIVGFKVSLKEFFIVAGVLLFCLYIYLHLYLEHIWEVLADLPAVFKDGMPVHRKIYPWMLLGQVKSFYPRLAKYGYWNIKFKIPHPSVFVPALLAWIVPIITMCFVSWKSDSILDIKSTPQLCLKLFMCAMLIMMTIFGLRSYIKAKQILFEGAK